MFMLHRFFKPPPKAPMDTTSKRSKTEHDRHLSVQVAHEIEHEQYNKHETKAAAAADRTAIGISTAAAQKDKDHNNKE